MKKCILVSIAFSFLFFYCDAQTRKFEVGVHGGINAGSLYGPGANYNKSYRKLFVGAVGGLQCRYQLSKKYALKSLFQFEQHAIISSDIKLYSIRSGSLIGQGDIISKLSYITIPITLERNFGGKIKFNINAGFFTGFLVSDKVLTKIKYRISAAGQSLPPKLEIFEEDNGLHRLMNLGLSLGAGVLLPVSKKVKLTANVQDNLGLLDIFKEGFSSNFYVKTNSLSIVTGVLFSF